MDRINTRYTYLKNLCQALQGESPVWEYGDSFSQMMEVTTVQKNFETSRVMGSYITAISVGGRLPGWCERVRRTNVHTTCLYQMHQ